MTELKMILRYLIANFIATNNLFSVLNCPNNIMTLVFYYVYRKTNILYYYLLNKLYTEIIKRNIWLPTGYNVYGIIISCNIIGHLWKLPIVAVHWKRLTIVVISMNKFLLTNFTSQKAVYNKTWTLMFCYVQEYLDTEVSIRKDGWI